MVLELLKKADILTERDEPGKAVTYNNLACYYRRCKTAVTICTRPNSNPDSDII